MTSLIKELHALTESVGKNVWIKSYFPHGSSREWENGTILVTCNSNEQANQLAAELKKRKDWWQAAAERVAEEKGIYADEIKKIPKSDAPEVEVVSHDDGEIEMSYAEFKDEVLED
jgi:hypothetical protein